MRPLDNIKVLTDSITQSLHSKMMPLSHERSVGPLADARIASTSSDADPFQKEFESKTQPH